MNFHFDKDETTYHNEAPCASQVGTVTYLSGLRWCSTSRWASERTRWSRRCGEALLLQPQQN